MVQEICFAKDERAVDHSTVTRLYEKFCLHWKNLENQVRSGKPKTVDSEAVLQEIGVNRTSSIGESQASLASYCPVWSVTFMTLTIASKDVELCLTLPKYGKNFDSS